MINYFTLNKLFLIFNIFLKEVEIQFKHKDLKVDYKR